VLRRIFGPKRDEETGGWRKLHKEELHKLYYSPSIITMIESRRLRWTGHVARMGRRIMYVEFWLEIQKERGHLEDQDVVRINNKIDLREIGWCGMAWIDLAQDRKQ
jgi:hypothetical protein